MTAEQILILTGDMVLFCICTSFVACLAYVIIGSLYHSHKKKIRDSEEMFLDGSGELLDYREEVAEYKNTFS